MNTITLTFTISELEVIDNALGNTPYKLAAPIIASINAQIQNNKLQGEVISRPENDNR